MVARLSLVDHAPATLDAALVALGLLVLITATARNVWGLPHLFGAVAFAIGVGGSVFPYHSWLAFPAAMTPVVFYALGRKCPDGLRPRLTLALTLAACAHVVVALYQRFVKWPAIIAAGPGDGIDESTINTLAMLRPVGLAFSPDLFGVVCVVGMVGAVTLWGHAKRDAAQQKAPIAPPGLSVGLGVFLLVGAALSRSFGIAFTVVGTAALFVLLKTRRPLLLLIPLAASPLVFLVRSPARLLLSASERFENWSAALTVWGQQPLFGVGFFRYPYVYAQLRTPGTNETLYAHQGPLQLAAELGLLGVMGALLVVAAVTLGVWRTSRARAQDAVNSSELLVRCGLFFLIAHGAIDYEWHVAQTGAAVGLALGLFPAASASTSFTSRRRQGVLVLWLLLVGATTVTLAVREQALNSFQLGDATLIDKYASAIPMDVPTHLAPLSATVVQMRRCRAAGGDCSAVDRDFIIRRDKAFAISPPLPAARVLAAQGAATMKQHDVAMKFVDEALELSPGSRPAHRLGIRLARAFAPAEYDARLASAKRWQVYVDDLLSAQRTPE